MSNVFTLDKFHHKKRTTAGMSPSIQHTGDVRMVHRGQRLSFQFEPRNRLGRFQADPNDLQGDFSPHWLLLFG